MKEVQLLEYVDESIYKNLSMEAINSLVKEGYKIGNDYTLRDIEDFFESFGEAPRDMYLEKEYTGFESSNNYWEVSVEDSEKILDFLNRDSNNILIINSKGKYLAKHHTCLCYEEETAEALEFVFSDKNIRHYMSEVDPSFKGLKSKVIGKRLGIKSYNQIANCIDLLINPSELLDKTEAGADLSELMSDGGKWGVYFALRLIECKMEIVGCRGYMQAIEN